MSEIELKARELLASCLNEWGHHQEAGNVRDGEDLESYEFELRVIGQLIRFGFDTGYGHATRAPQWQPIESAPKTTRSILVWCPERQNQYMVFWDSRYEGEWRTVGGGTSITEAPTHWQPLPAPPEVEG
ncbi:DUF551 domain-containing protein [Stenotrophomonas sp. 2MCAF14_2]|uniref:DUF551 domain-containing protein n=1 Tax=Stenotrophomonas sp. 2MCAF14_2 TaxID=3232983 RepID=UPI003F9D9E70